MNIVVLALAWLACISCVHGSAASGPFSDVQPLEMSESATTMQELLSQEKRQSGIPAADASQLWSRRPKLKHMVSGPKFHERIQQLAKQIKTRGDLVTSSMLEQENHRGAHGFDDDWEQGDPRIQRHLTRLAAQSLGAGGDLADSSSTNQVQSGSLVEIQRPSKTDHPLEGLPSCPHAMQSDGLPLEATGLVLLSLKLATNPLKSLGMLILAVHFDVVDLQNQEQPSDRAATIGAASIGGILGVQAFGGLRAALAMSLLLAYASTLSNRLGSGASAAGRFAARAYSKALEINEKYEVLLKAKKATDMVMTAAGRACERVYVSAVNLIGKLFELVWQFLK